MGEPERRRRRLRTPSSTPAAPGPPATEPRSDAVIETVGPDESAAVETAPDETAAVETAPVQDPEVPEPVPQRPIRRPPRPASGPGGGGEEVERGLRGLVGSGSSQVSVGAALRARDAARPTDAHLADAEENLTIVRRNWTPREDLPRRP
jgi:hypothetical protein